MRTPSYKGCDGSCVRGKQSNISDRAKQCWRMNHIPFAGYLYQSYSRNVALILIFERYVRMKKIVFPEEVVKFVDLFRAKHPEIPIKTFYNDYPGISYFGVYWHPGKYDNIRNLFGRDGLIYTDRPVDEMITKNKPIEKIFMEFAIKSMMKGEICPT